MVGPGQGAWGRKSPSGVQGQSSGRPVGGLWDCPQEAAEKCEIYTSLTISCTKFRI